MSSSGRMCGEWVARSALGALLSIVAMTGCAGATDATMGPDWRRVMADQSGSQQVDVHSLMPHEDGWAAWTQSPLRERDMPDGMSLAPGGNKRVRMHVDCGPHSIAVRFLEARILAADGQLLHTTKPGDPGADKYPSADGVTYEENTISMICAAAAARCEGSALEWPLPTRDDPRFVPTCKAF